MSAIASSVSWVLSSTHLPFYSPRTYPPIAPTLPVETTLQILNYVATEMHSSRDRLTFLGLAAKDDSQKAWMKRIGASRRTLRNAALIGPNWCAAANELLYSHVILLSHRQIRLFSRTLKRSKQLRHIVKELSILLALDVPLVWTSQNVRKPDYVSLMDRNTCMRNDIFQILHHLPSLDTLSIRFQDPLSIAFGYGDMLMRSPLHSLRRLTIHGYSLCTSLSVRGFPTLEVLCLHGIIFDPQFAFPYIPQLHTLQVCQTEGWCSVLGDLISPASLPALRVLQLYNNKFSDNAFCRKARRSFPRPLCLHLIGIFEVQCFGTLAEIGVLDNLQHFAIGNIDCSFGEHPFHKWRIPKSLETLTVMEDLHHRTSRSNAALTSCLEQSLENYRSGNLSLHQVRYHEYNGELDEPVRKFKAFDIYNMIFRRISKQYH